MPANHIERINEAIATREFVRIGRRFEDTPIHGYVLAAGPRHFVMALVNDRVWYDGFECFRLKDIRSVAPDPYADFAKAALRLRGQRKPRTPRLDLTSMQTLLASAGALFPLVTIHREKIQPDVCHIGRVVATSDKEVTLLEIDPGAVWEEATETYSIKQITRVNFGGGYEDALALVGGAALDDGRGAGVGVGATRRRTARK